MVSADRCVCCALLRLPLQLVEPLAYALKLGGQLFERLQRRLERPQHYFGGRVCARLGRLSFRRRLPFCFVFLALLGLLLFRERGIRFLVAHHALQELDLTSERLCGRLRERAVVELHPGIEVFVGTIFAVRPTHWAVHLVSLENLAEAVAVLPDLLQELIALGVGRVPPDDGEPHQLFACRSEKDVFFVGGQRDSRLLKRR